MNKYKIAYLTLFFAGLGQLVIVFVDLNIWFKGDYYPLVFSAVLCIAGAMLPAHLEENAKRIIR
jgi:hypothetical protein